MKADTVLTRYGMEFLLLVGALIAAIVFVLQPGMRLAKPAAPPPVGAPGSSVSNPGMLRSTSAKLKIPSLGRSPTRPIFGSLPFSDEDRSRQLNLCMGRARGAPTYPGDGVGVAELAHTGLVGDSLGFDGPAHNLTTGRQLVWRCVVGDWDGRVGGSRFSTLESIDGVPLEWNAIASIDEDVLRSCVVKAASLFPGRDVPPYTLGGRRGDIVALNGSFTAADGFYGEWYCEAHLEKGRIASLDVRQGKGPI